jgi:transposase
VEVVLGFGQVQGESVRQEAEAGQGLLQAVDGKLVDWAKLRLNATIKTVSRPKGASGFVLLPRRWVVERSLASMMRARRHTRDYERLIQHSET